MPKLFNVHFTLIDTDEQLSETVEAENPKQADVLIRSKYSGQRLSVRKVKFVKGSENGQHERSQGGSSN